MNIDEIYTNIMIEFERLHARLDKIENPTTNVTISPVEIKGSPSYDEIIKALEKDYGKQPLPKVWYDSKTQSIGSDEQCFWVNMSLEDRMKPMSLSCPCKRCSPMSCSSGVGSIGTPPGVDKLN
jgi:hypothetical protein